MSTKEEILSGLSSEQKEAVINYNGKTSLEAIPGSGKTRTLVTRCQYMVKDGVRPSRILVFTFTKKAANELKERIQAAIGSDADKMTICTYHSFCGKILRRFPEYFGRTKNFSIYDEDEKKSLLKKIQSKFKQANENVKVTMSFISNFKMKGLTPKDVMSNTTLSPYEKIAGMIYEVYEKELEKRNAVDFDDLPFYAYKLTSTNKEVLDYIATRYDYILSDENQDANKQNMDFILLLGSRSHNIFVVGDTDQSIYGFRGADVDNVIRTYKKQDFTIRYLSTNYRSTQNIVNAANFVISNNKSRLEKRLVSLNESGSKIKYVKCLDQVQEAAYIANKIKILKNSSDKNYKDFAVLTRLQDQTMVLEKEFLKQHIPYQLKGIVPFFSRAEIKDILSYLKLAYNTKDLNAFERVINVPKRGIGEATKQKILLSDYSIDDIINTRAVISKLGISVKARKGFAEFIKIISDIQKFIKEQKNVCEILTYVINATGYEDYLNEQVDVPGTLVQKQCNLTTLQQLGATYDNNIEDFMNNAYLGNDNETVNDDGSKTEEDVDAVNIMTIHSSKGLEFNTVFICDCTDSYLPFFKSHQDPVRVEEERRLFYVAMTRAKKELYFMFPFRTTRKNGNHDLSVESRFLQEIPEKFLEKLLIKAKA